MSLTVRLDPALERSLVVTSRRFSKSKSEIIKASLLQYLETQREADNPFELGKDLFGKTGSRHGRLSTLNKSTLRKKIREKNIG